MIRGQSDHQKCASLADAVGTLTQLVENQNGGDGAYFKGQRNRYLYSVDRMMHLCPPPCRVLDIGSHYLHQAGLLSLLGYTVTGLDIPLFTDRAFVQERAAALKITNIASGGQQTGEFLEEYGESFDLIVCTEIIEHITFNPVAFWNRVWHLLAPSGVIYITTPNSFRVRALVKALIRLVTLEGLGLSVNEILTVVTYGHHWKEYSCREIRNYFQRLSADFIVETRTYGHDERQNSILSKCLEVVPSFRSNIEAVVTLRGKTVFAEPPLLPMQASPSGPQAVNS